MANLRDIKKRITSTQNIRKITSTMEKVSTSKIKKATDLMLHSRPYHRSLYQLVHDLIASSLHRPGTPQNKLLIEGRKKSSKAMIIIITSDRGLCGGFNTNILAKAEELAETLIEQKKSVVWAIIGKKAVSTFRFQKKSALYAFQEVDEKNLAFEQTFIKESLLPDFFKETFDELYVVYAHYESLSKQKPHVHKVLPLAVDGDIEKASEFANQQHSHQGSNQPHFLKSSGSAEIPSVSTILYDMEPETDLGLSYLLPKLIQSILFHARLENMVSEHIARRIAMKQATDAAEDIIYDLRRLYNRTRQSKITNDLIEIVSTANAIKK